MEEVVKQAIGMHWILRVILYFVFVVSIAPLMAKMVSEAVSDYMKKMKDEKKRKAVEEREKNPVILFFSFSLLCLI
jgi:hypothetical protein